jgi:dynein heavy chain
MISCVGSEYVEFTDPLKLLGKVECYMQDVIDFMRKSLRDIAVKSYPKSLTNPRVEWLKDDAAQCTLLVCLNNWVASVEKGFVDDNVAGALKSCIDELTNLIKMVMDASMSKALRTKVMCMITMDAHSRDILQILRDENVKKPDHFKWQSQMKAYYEDDVKDFNLKIADASFYYGYEYLGNGPRLVVTPLTDRIYVTAT